VAFGIRKSDRKTATTCPMAPNKQRRGIVRDERGQNQPATKDDAQRTSGDARAGKKRCAR
jgi:hypothetical protein